MCLLCACGARKVKTQKQQEKQTTEAKADTSTKAETVKEQTGEASTKLDTDFLGFNIEPVNGVPAVFTFKYAGKKIEGSTTGKLNFSNEKKHEETRIRWQNKIHTTYVTHTKYQTHTTYKSLMKERRSDKKAYPWWQLCIGAVLLWELLKLLTKKLLPFNVPIKSKKP